MELPNVEILNEGINPKVSKEKPQVELALSTIEKCDGGYQLTMWLSPFVQSGQVWQIWEYWIDIKIVTINATLFDNLPNKEASKYLGGIFKSMNDDLRKLLLQKGVSEIPPALSLEFMIKKTFAVLGATNQ